MGMMRPQRSVVQAFRNIREHRFRNGCEEIHPLDLQIQRGLAPVGDVVGRNADNQIAGDAMMMVGAKVGAEEKMVSKGVFGTVGVAITTGLAAVAKLFHFIHHFAVAESFFRHPLHSHHKLPTNALALQPKEPPKVHK
jgi:hypothetical protein